MLEEQSARAISDSQDCLICTYEKVMTVSYVQIRQSYLCWYKIVNPPRESRLDELEEQSARAAETLSALQVNLTVLYVRVRQSGLSYKTDRTVLCECIGQSYKKIRTRSSPRAPPRHSLPSRSGCRVFLSAASATGVPLS